MGDVERANRLRDARISRGFATAKAAAESFGWNLNTYGSNENGNAAFSYQKAKAYAAAFGVRAEWLYDGAMLHVTTTDDPQVPVIGRVGADAEGIVLFASGQST